MNKAAILKTGNMYETISQKRDDSVELQNCIVDTVNKLIENDTSVNRPGMLLGRIQSGKTRAFIGIIAQAFDHDYDLAIILTKGTKALARQTYMRLLEDFKDFVEDDLVQIFDIMHTPENLPRYVLEQKIIMVVKKETNNLKRIIKALTETYPDLKDKKLLIVDDEADFASIGFNKKTKEDTLELKKIASQIDSLRTEVAVSDFLQVTATPYSLYLQPDEIEISGDVFKPIRPAFTVLLPMFKGYVGGDFYFSSDDKSSIAPLIYEEVLPEEVEVLKKEDRRVFKLEDALTSKKIASLRMAVINFIVGAYIRREQLSKNNQKNKKYSFIIHTEQGKAAHAWQERIFQNIKDALVEYAINFPDLLEPLIKASYDDLLKSLTLINPGDTPDFSTVFNGVIEYLKKDYLMITKVNSETEVEQLLDANGQLKLVTPLNIFIGGQILDRGITIDNLIGFYYGRRPNKFQQDTVLQHSRMYGNRSMEDIAVTRFYTPIHIYENMKRIHAFDNALREAFEEGAHDAGVVFIQKDAKNRIIPCSPNKILLTTTTTIKPLKRMVPYGFQTGYKSYISKTIDKIDTILKEYEPQLSSKDPFYVDLETAKIIIDEIYSTLNFSIEHEWDVNAFKASIEYLSKNIKNENERGKVWCLIRTNRNSSRYSEIRQRFLDVPESEDIAQLARKYAVDIPVLVLLRQNGKEESGWKGTPFWWPLMFAPVNMQTVIFANEVSEEE